MFSVIRLKLDNGLIQVISAICVYPVCQAPGTEEIFKNKNKPNICGFKMVYFVRKP